MDNYDKNIPIKDKAEISVGTKVSSLRTHDK